jgi:TonB family protein
LAEIGVFMKFDAIIMALFVVINSQSQIAEFETQALASVRRQFASNLDKGLPERPLMGWFTEIVGVRAGVFWQLSECGGPVSTSLNEEDLPACVEVNALLPNESKVIVWFRVGTFKGGLEGNPVFFSAVVEYKHQFYKVQRLRDLPMVIHWAERKPVTLPAINAKRTLFKPDYRLSPISTPEISSDPSLTPVTIPPPQWRKVGEGVAYGFSLSLRLARQQHLQKVAEEVAQGWALARIVPVYPPGARKIKAYGPVKVRIIISQEGRVIEATAISGHLALRHAAVETARRWIFKPIIIDGVRVNAESILTFVFARGSHLGQLAIEDNKSPKDLITSPH